MKKKLLAVVVLILVLVTSMAFAFDTIRLIRAHSTEWTGRNPILSIGDVGFETDTNKIKFGDGNAAWTGLSYAAPAATGATTITTLGTIATGVWQGTAIADGYISSASTWNAKAPGTGAATITTLGTVATGTWQATAIADGYIASAATWSAKQAALNGAYVASFNTRTGAATLTAADVASAYTGSTNFVTAGIITAGTLSTSSTVTAGLFVSSVTVTASKAVCWKADAKTLGYCSDTPTNGDCTCN